MVPTHILCTRCPKTSLTQVGPKNRQKGHTEVFLPAKGAFGAKYLPLIWVWDVTQMERGFHLGGMNNYGQGGMKYLWNGGGMNTAHAGHRDATPEHSHCFTPVPISHGAQNFGIRPGWLAPLGLIFGLDCARGGSLKLHLFSIGIGSVGHARGGSPWSCLGSPECNSQLCLSNSKCSTVLCSTRTCVHARVGGAFFLVYYLLKKLKESGQNTLKGGVSN